MTAQILDGTATLRTIKAELTERVAALREHGVTPGLGTVLVGDDPGSHWYVGAKHKDCAAIGITSLRRDLPASASQAEVEAVIDELNADQHRAQPGGDTVLAERGHALGQLVLDRAEGGGAIEDLCGHGVILGTGRVTPATGHERRARIRRAVRDVRRRGRLVLRL